MAKVKVFQNLYAEVLENEINEFIKSYEVDSIIDIKFSTSAVAIPDDHGIYDPMSLYSALVHYQEAVEPPFKDGTHPAFQRG